MDDLVLMEVSETLKSQFIFSAFAATDSCSRWQMQVAPHPQDLPADVGDPLLLQRVPFGIFDQVCDRAGPAELHHQLHTNT